MKKRALLLTLLSLTSAASALEIEPWFGDIWQFEFDAAYTYSWYKRVQHAIVQPKGTSHVNLLALGLGVSPADRWSADLDVEFVATRVQSFGYRSAAGQVRYLWFDDVVGDWASLTTGLSVRGVSEHSLKDVSCPYHAKVNAEFHIALGKEWADAQTWYFRPFGFASVGVGSRGSPWTRALVALQGNFRDRHHFQGWGEGYVGFGRRRAVDVQHFHGYGHIRHRSIDLGIGYSYLFDYYGALSFEYIYRVYARSYPENQNFFVFRYQIPFSFF